MTDPKKTVVGESEEESEEEPRIVFDPFEGRNQVGPAVFPDAKVKHVPLPPNKGKERFTVPQIKQAIELSHGVLSIAARKLKCQRSTITTYMKRYPELREWYHEITEENLDAAEAGLLQHIGSGNLAAIIFFLKTKGKHRGYIERGELTGADGGPVEVDRAAAREGLSGALARLAERAGAEGFLERPKRSGDS